MGLTSCHTLKRSKPENLSKKRLKQLIEACQKTQEMIKNQSSANFTYKIKENNNGFSS
jgi:hypothetical protein